MEFSLLFPTAAGIMHPSKDVRQINVTAHVILLAVMYVVMNVVWLGQRKGKSRGFSRACGGLVVLARGNGRGVSKGAVGETQVVVKGQGRREDWGKGLGGAGLGPAPLPSRNIGTCVYC